MDSRSRRHRDAQLSLLPCRQRSAQHSPRRLQKARQSAAEKASIELELQIASEAEKQQQDSAFIMCDLFLYIYIYIMKQGRSGNWFAWACGEKANNAQRQESFQTAQQQALLAADTADLQATQAAGRWLADQSASHDWKELSALSTLRLWNSLPAGARCWPGSMLLIMPSQERQRQCSPWRICKLASGFLVEG